VAVNALVAPLVECVREWADESDAPRLVTARACADLVTQVQRAKGAAVVRALAEFDAGTSLTAMGRSFTTAESARRLLTERPRWIVFEQILNLVHDGSRGHRATLLLEDLSRVLSADEVNQMLADGLAELTRRSEELLRVTLPPAPPQEPGWKTVLHKSIRVDDPARLAELLRSLTSEVEDAAAGAGALRVDLSAVVARREPNR
jgi:hypothetical protein